MVTSFMRYEIIGHSREEVVVVLVTGTGTNGREYSIDRAIINMYLTYVISN
jgi:hypothetical protein